MSAKYVMTKEQQEAYDRMMMISILQTLNDEGMLSDEQLRLGISMVNSQNTCTSDKIAV
jgi:hypothetical protein